MRIDTLSFLPQFLLKNPDIWEVLQAEQQELDRFLEYIELMRDQCAISSASIYLDRYERMFGLDVSPALSDSERIGKILAKLNTRTNSTVEAIKTVVSSITGCSTDITEYYADYTFDIEVLRSNEQLINIEDIKQAVERIKPAHLAFSVIMCWKWTIGIQVNSTIYVISHDVCGDGGGEYDYCGETPGISYLASVNAASLQVDTQDKAYRFPYQFAGQYPSVSTLGKTDEDTLQIAASKEAVAYDFDMGVTETGTLPFLATLGAQNEENGQIEVETENYATPLLFAHENDDYCGED